MELTADILLLLIKQYQCFTLSKTCKSLIQPLIYLNLLPIGVNKKFRSIINPEQTFTLFWNQQVKRLYSNFYFGFMGSMSNSRNKIQNIRFDLHDDKQKLVTLTFHNIPKDEEYNYLMIKLAEQFQIKYAY
jgi:hypothetical protein